MEHGTDFLNDAGEGRQETLDGLVSDAEGQGQAQVALRERSHCDEDMARASQVGHAR